MSRGPGAGCRTATVWGRWALRRCAAVAVCAWGCAAPKAGRKVRPDEGYPGLVLAPSAVQTAGEEGAATLSGEPLNASSRGAIGHTTATEPAQGGIPVHGSLFTRYRGRRNPESDDHDLYTTLALDIGDHARHLFTGHFMGRFNIDLGGDDPNDTYFALDDALGGSANGILYYAYVDTLPEKTLDKVRIGRQQVWDTPVHVVFDGVLADASELSGIRFGAYGGRRVQYHDRNAPSDVVGGVYGVGRPWTGGRLRLDYMYLEDDDRLGSGEDELLGLELWQLVGSKVTLEGGYTRLEGQERDRRMRALYSNPSSELSIQASFYELLRTQSQQALEIDPYFSSLMELHPYRQLGLLASKGFEDVLNVSLGIDLRRLDHESDVGELNHEFDHFSFTTLFPKVLLEGLDVTLIGDVWNDDQQDVRTWGLDLTQRIDRSLEGSLGSYYSLYKYDLFLERERDDVRTYYARVRWRPASSWTSDLGYQYEDDDLAEHHTLTLGVRWTF